MELSQDFIEEMSRAIVTKLWTLEACCLPEKPLPEGLERDIAAIAELARKRGYVVYDITSQSPEHIIIGSEHLRAMPPDYNFRPNPQCLFLSELLEKELIKPEDNFVIEGLPPGKVVDANYFDPRCSFPAYLYHNREQILARGIQPIGFDDNELLAAEERYFDLTIALRERGMREKSKQMFFSATEAIAKRSQRHLEGILGLQGRTFLSIGYAHIFAGILTEGLEKSGKGYVALVQKE